jgi:hypothetical protein
MYEYGDYFIAAADPVSYLIASSTRVDTGANGNVLLRCIQKK